MIKRVLVYAGDSGNDEATYRAAANFSVQNNCELTGVFVTPDYTKYSAIRSNAPVDLAEQFYKIQKKLEKKSHEQFEDVLKEFSCNAQWRELTENDAQRILGFYSDLIFVSQPNPKSNDIFCNTDFVDHLIMGSGLPTIIIPADWDQSELGKHPLLGWKETREAVAAVRQTMPIMQAAEKVDIVTVVSKFNEERDLINGIEISSYLADHDVDCKYSTLTAAADENNESSALMRHALSHKCDLIIIGAYSHSRFRELILGGVTRGLLRKSKIPVLMGH